MVHYLFGRAHVGNLLLIDPEKALSNINLLYTHLNHLMELMETYSPNVTPTQKNGWQYYYEKDYVVVKNDELYKLLKKHLGDMTVTDFLTSDDNKILDISSALARDLYRNFLTFNYDACCVAFDRLTYLRVLMW